MLEQLLAQRRTPPEIDIQLVGYQNFAASMDPPPIRFSNIPADPDRQLLALAVATTPGTSMNFDFVQLQEVLTGGIAEAAYYNWWPTTTGAHAYMLLIRQPSGTAFDVKPIPLATPNGLAVYLFSIKGSLNTWGSSRARPIGSAMSTTNGADLKIGGVEKGVTVFLSVARKDTSVVPTVRGGTIVAQNNLGTDGKSVVGIIDHEYSAETTLNVNWSNAPTNVVTIAFTLAPKPVSQPSYSWRGVASATFAAKNSHTFTNVDIGPAARDRYLVLILTADGSTRPDVATPDYSSSFYEIGWWHSGTYKHFVMRIIAYPKDVSTVDLTVTGTGMTYAAVGVWAVYGLPSWGWWQSRLDTATGTEDLIFNNMNWLDGSFCFGFANSDNQSTDYSMSGWTERIDSAVGANHFAFFDTVKAVEGLKVTESIQETVSSNRQGMLISFPVQPQPWGVEYYSWQGSNQGSVVSLPMRLCVKPPGNRVVAVFIAWYNSSWCALQSVKIGGVQATIAVNGYSAVDFTRALGSAWAYATLNDFEITPTLEATFSTGPDQFAYQAYSLWGVSTVHHDTDSANSSSGSVTLGNLDTPAFGYKLVGAAARGTQGTFSVPSNNGWTGAAAQDLQWVTAPLQRNSVDDVGEDIFVSQSNYDYIVARAISFARALP